MVAPEYIIYILYIIPFDDIHYIQCFFNKIFKIIGSGSIGFLLILIWVARLGKQADPAWKKELSMAKSKIRESLNKELGAELIREVRVVW